MKIMPCASHKTEAISFRAERSSFGCFGRLSWLSILQTAYWTQTYGNGPMFHLSSQTSLYDHSKRLDALASAFSIIHLVRNSFAKKFIILYMGLLQLQSTLKIQFEINLLCVAIYKNVKIRIQLVANVRYAHAIIILILL